MIFIKKIVHFWPSKKQVTDGLDHLTDGPSDRRTIRQADHPTDRQTHPRIEPYLKIDRIGKERESETPKPSQKQAVKSIE